MCDPEDPVGGRSERMAYAGTERRAPSGCGYLPGAEVSDNRRASLSRSNPRRVSRGHPGSTSTGTDHRPPNGIAPLELEIFSWTEQ